MKVELINITNNPIETIYKAYRICYSKGGFNKIKIPSEEKMIEFIKPLMAENHTSPLEHVSFTFNIEGISRACLAQITRHRTGKFNCQSQRYVDGSNFDFVMPNLDYIDKSDTKELITSHYNKWFEESKKMYMTLVNNGVKKEDARAILPQATTCNMLVTFDLNNFRKMCNQRLCNHAQKEIREMAKLMMSLVKEYIPFADYKVMNCGITCNQCIN
ncbi:FAD-dependent thymidylate synthase [Clostridium paraputrificum]|uniref:FAD-dependent thymidylate synthase n=1 Tax=Clostridium paraputrificum TaxID=29363 RepID=UPI00189D4167|nr:FAD-dependent thymidylate synthase [Clostridium paraputrificum]